MVTKVLKYQWRTTLAPFRKGAKASEVFGLIAIIIMALFLGLSYFAYVTSTGRLGVDSRGSTTAVAGASLIVFWIVLPVLFGSQSTYTDPSRYAVFPRRARELMPAFVMAGLLGMGGIVTFLAAVSHIFAWSSSGTVDVVAAGLGVLLGWAGAMVASNLLLAAMSAVLAKRRFRETMMILLWLLCCGLAVGMQFVLRADPTTTEIPVHVGRIVGWTPLGWSWSMPWEAANGSWLAFVVKLLFSVVVLALMVGAWGIIVDRRLVSPTGDGDGAEKVTTESRIDRIFPATPTGAIAGRTLRYMKRDPRMVSVLLTTFLVPVLSSIPMFINDTNEASDTTSALFFTGFPFVVLLWVAPLYAGSLVSYDGTALWHHIEASISGAEDRRGRAIAYLIATTPIGLVLAFVLVWRCGQWELLPVVVAEAWSALLLSTGIGSWMGVVIPVRVAENRKGGGFNSGWGSLGASYLGVLIGMAVGSILSAPIVFLVVLVGISGHSWQSIVLTFVVGLGWSFLVLHLGIIVGGRRLDRSWHEVLEKITPVA
ncbi:ABC transporter permease [Cutibacterium sp.]|uniref:ABC transporter permease n=1 Tax=Cutibacterium sp. TaxID=1912221 RepID=UPI0026DC5757|nr:ABC transporter permease [Cutibacterium sp.]MDO4413129.1 ABC transporter permease [Cutibacterium sp.]